jgi:hypothetical protein
MPFRGGFTFSNFLVDAFSIFMFVVWFWLLITIFSDMFRRQDMSGLAKLIWVIVLIGIPLSGHLRLPDHAKPGPGRAAEPADATSPRRYAPLRRLQRRR